jgi:hypothetical protein
MRSTKQFQENTDFRLAEPPLAGAASAWHPRKPEKIVVHGLSPGLKRRKTRRFQR